MLHLQLLEITSAIPHHQPNTRHSFFVSTRTFSSNSASPVSAANKLQQKNKQEIKHVD
ncbi:hypothetical protein POPTR_019G036825v4 [Populus trichocarpa]|uniref:Uncharacterized protein n=1 Tax=Populus trichocarpa TaxID=3694 RepID=A0ACC0RIX4_POPTR|nr:hypothetical protein POPTR_019G036825v4 [Populus trichocarpa]